MFQRKQLVDRSAGVSYRMVVLPSTKKNEFCINGRYVFGIEQSLLLRYDMKEEIRLYLDYLIEFVYGKIIPLIFPQFSDTVFQTRCQIRQKNTSPSRASLAAKPTAELSLMPTWPGTQTKTISFPSRIKSEYSS